MFNVIEFERIWKRQKGIPGICNNAGLAPLGNKRRRRYSNANPCGFCDPCEDRREEYLNQNIPKLIRLVKERLGGPHR